MHQATQQDVPSEILVVDDIPANLKLLNEVLIGEGYRVRPATGGQLALRSVALRPPDLILLDVKMPGMDGYEVCQALKAEEKSRDIPVIFISALDEIRDKIKGFKAGGVDYITKPFEETEVLARVATHLTLRRLQARLERQNNRLQLEIAERRQVEAALRQSENTYRTVVENTGTALAILEESKIISLANSRFAKLSGYSKEEIEGKMFWTSFVVPEDLEKMEKNHALRRIDPHTVPTSYEFRFVNRQRIITDTVLNVAMIPETQKSVASLMDVSALRKMAVELQRARKWESIGIFAGGIAHDFNNLLGIILGNIDLAAMSLEHSISDVHKYLKGAERACQQSSELTQRMIALTESIRPCKGPQGIRELIADAVSTVLSGTDVHGDLDLAEDLCPVDCDAVQIKEMVMHLTVNALEASEQGGTIDISARNELLTMDSSVPVNAGKYVHLILQDHGKGIPTDVFPQIFDPYFTTKQRGSQKGMGMGLTMAYVIVKRHYGDIILDSKAGGGTIVHVYLPAFEPCTDIFPPLQR
ncbi:MAG: response regulator [Desulfobulbus sp.]